MRLDANSGLECHLTQPPTPLGSSIPGPQSLSTRREARPALNKTATWPNYGNNRIIEIRRGAKAVVMSLSTVERARLTMRTLGARLSILTSNKNKCMLRELANEHLNICMARCFSGWSVSCRSHASIAHSEPDFIHDNCRVFSSMNSAAFHSVHFSPSLSPPITTISPKHTFLPPYLAILASSLEWLGVSNIELSGYSNQYGIVIGPPLHQAFADEIAPFHASLPSQP